MVQHISHVLITFDPWNQQDLFISQCSNLFILVNICSCTTGLPLRASSWRGKLGTWSNSGFVMDPKWHPESNHSHMSMRHKAQGYLSTWTDCLQKGTLCAQRLPQSKMLYIWPNSTWRGMDIPLFLKRYKQSRVKKSKVDVVFLFGCRNNSDSI